MVCQFTLPSACLAAGAHVITHPRVSRAGRGQGRSASLFLRWMVPRPQEAERLIAMARGAGRGDLYDQYAEPQAAIVGAEAQVHATLATALAAALGTSPVEARAWADVAGTSLSNG